MSVSDPIGDMLTRIRNGQQAGLEVVEIPHSRLKAEIARLLKREGFVADYATEGAARKVLRVYLKYGRGRRPVMAGLRALSHPGQHRYVGVREIPKVRGGMGVVILSTSAGVLTDREAREKKVGGELLCAVW